MGFFAPLGNNWGFCYLIFSAMPLKNAALIVRWRRETLLFPLTTELNNALKLKKNIYMRVKAKILEIDRVFSNFVNCAKSENKRDEPHNTFSLRHNTIFLMRRAQKINQNVWKKQQRRTLIAYPITFWIFTHGKIKPKKLAARKAALRWSAGKMRPEKEEKSWSERE